jgi:hypothetical protein
VTPALSRRCSNQLSYWPSFFFTENRSDQSDQTSLKQSGGMGIRTPDIQLAKLTLYQLSYTPSSRD